VAIRARLLLHVAVSGLLFAPWAAFAAHPLQTEDTGTQGAANVEIENGLSRARFDSTALTIYQPQLSVGVATSVDAILQPALTRLQTPGRTAVTGWGDTNLDGKWRFWGSDPWSLALRAGVLVPTSRKDLGLPHGEVSEHALLVATWDGAPATVHANLGLTRVPRALGTRTSVAHVSAAVMQSINDGLVVAADGEFHQASDPASKAWPGSLLGGLIWTARPGLDLDIGYHRSFSAQPVNRQWLAGLTWRFSL
jgi:hypothetical protein